MGRKTRREQGLEEGRYELCCSSLFAGPVENDTSDSDEYVGDNSNTDDDDCHLDDAEDDDDEYAESKPPPQKRRATKAPAGGKTSKGKGVPRASMVLAYVRSKAQNVQLLCYSS